MNQDDRIVKMHVDVERLRQARAFLHGGRRRSGEAGLMTAMYELTCEEARRLSAGDPDKRTQIVCDALCHANWELYWTVETLMKRLEWQRQLWMKSVLDDGNWACFASADIALFHIASRSIFNHLARVIATASVCPDEVPGKSFEVLAKWVRKQSTQRLGKCGGPVLDLVREAEPWFRLLREVRNGIVHHGRNVFVSPQKPRILFNCPNSVRACLPALLVVEGRWVDFELYGGVMYGYLLAYLESVGEALWKALDVLREVTKAQGNRAEVVYDGVPDEELRRIESMPSSMTDMSAGASSSWLDKAIEAFAQGPSSQDSAPGRGTA